MHVVDRGSGPAVVLVPGLGCDHSMYRPQLESLRGMRTLAVDLRGCGRSPSLDEVREEDVLAVQTADIAEMLRRRDIDRAHLVGISYGGVVVQEFALRYPGLTRSLVICDSLCDVRPRTLRERIEMWPAQLQPLALRLTPRPVLAASVRSVYKRWPKAAEAMASTFLDARMTDLITQRRVVNRTRLEEALRGCTIPALCMVGDHSSLAIGMMRRVHEALPASEFHLIPDSFDPSSLCNPASFTGHLERWTAKHSD